jgi:hypothetical protein
VRPWRFRLEAEKAKKLYRFTSAKVDFHKLI